MSPHDSLLFFYRMYQLSVFVVLSPYNYYQNTFLYLDRQKLSNLGHNSYFFFLNQLICRQFSPLVYARGEIFKCPVLTAQKSKTQR